MSSVTATAIGWSVTPSFLSWDVWGRWADFRLAVCWLAGCLLVQGKRWMRSIMWHEPCSLALEFIRFEKAIPEQRQFCGLLQLGFISLLLSSSLPESYIHCSLHPWGPHLGLLLLWRALVSLHLKSGWWELLAVSELNPTLNRVKVKKHIWNKHGVLKIFARTFYLTVRVQLFNFSKNTWISSKATYKIETGQQLQTFVFDLMQKDQKQ